jgi:hypothetical protein
MIDYFDFSNDVWNKEEKKIENTILTKEEKNFENITLTEEEKLLNESFAIEMYNEKYGVL